jgi:valyl-tRNA synthetase
VRVIHSLRRFSNKVYQACKYVIGKLDEGFIPSKEKKTGNESLAERWILHRLNIAAKKVNQQMNDREFSASTHSIYSFLYDDLCDVFIENSKAIIQDGSKEERLSAQNTLYTALEGGLLMLSIYMPFLTEELWQRLPRRPGDITPSITIAQFPEYDQTLDDPKAEEAYGIVLGASKGIRSLVSEYKVPDAKCKSRLDASAQTISLTQPQCSSKQATRQLIRSSNPSNRQFGLFRAKV